MNKSKLTILIALAALMFTSCEKDDVNQPNNRTMESNSKKKAGAINKSSELYNAIVDFIDGIEEDTLTVNHLAEDALKYTEATLNYRLTSDEYLPSESEVFSTTYEVPIYSDGGQLYISASEIQMMNDNLYNEIYTQADNFNFDNGNKDGKILTVIDVEWGALSSGSNEVSVDYVLSNFKDLPMTVGECDAQLSWHPVFNDGGCNGNSATTGDALQEISRIVNSRTCNNNLRPSCNQPILMNIKSTFHFYPNQLGYTTNSIWEGDRSDCLSPTQINTYRDSCLWIAQEENITSYHKLQSIVIGSDLILGGTLHNHWYQFYYAVCVGDIPVHLQHPQPCFGC